MAGRKMKEEGNSGRERGEGRADTCCLPHCLSSPSSSLSFCVSSSSSHSCFLPLLLLSFPPRSVWNNPRDPLAEEEGEPFGRGDDKTIGSVKGELTFSFFLFFFFRDRYALFPNRGTLPDYGNRSWEAEHGAGKSWYTNMQWQRFRFNREDVELENGLNICDKSSM